MPSNPPTVADLEAEVAWRCAVPLAEAGVYLRAVDNGGLPFTPAIRQGFRKGAVEDIRIGLAAPMAFTDADAANLSPYAVERVLDWGELFGLQMALLHWHRAIQKYQELAVSTTPEPGGWLMEEKRNTRERVGELKSILATPFREPSDSFVFSGPDPCRSSPWWSARPCLSDAVLPIGCDRFFGVFSPWL